MPSTPRKPAHRAALTQALTELHTRIIEHIPKPGRLSGADPQLWSGLTNDRGTLQLIALALTKGALDVCYLHNPRKSTSPGAPQRCRHDGNTWPCATAKAISNAMSLLEPRQPRDPYGPLPVLISLPIRPSKNPMTQGTSDVRKEDLNPS